MVTPARSVLLAGLCAAACAAPPTNDVSGIADQAPLPYSVLLTGGGFVDTTPTAVPDDELQPQTFGRAELFEPLPLGDIARALQAGRVFTRTVLDDARDEALRERIATHRAELPLGDPEIRRLLRDAREAGHDFVVVVQRLADGPVEDYGINDRWPLTVSMWLLVGLGMFIPDHTFESRATLQAGVYEVHTGRLVHRAVGSAGPVELSLVSRGNLWGLIQSILVPPFWVASSPTSLIAEVREVTQQRLVVGLARQLKSASCRQDLSERARATIDVVRTRGESDGGTVVRVRSEEPLGAVAFRVDGRPPDAAEGERFTSTLLGSEVVVVGGGLLYEARLPATPGGRYLHVLVRTVAGDVASVTFDLEGK